MLEEPAEAGWAAMALSPVPAFAVALASITPSGARLGMGKAVVFRVTVVMSVMMRMSHGFP